LGERPETIGDSENGGKGQEKDIKNKLENLSVRV